MLQLTNLNSSPCRRWCSAIVLLAVCSLTVSVTTRYSLYPRTTGSAVKTIQKLTSTQPRCQRLLKNAAVWLPPVVSSDVLEAPRSYPRSASAGPPIPSLLFEDGLYNRPPPFSIPSHKYCSSAGRTTQQMDHNASPGKFRFVLGLIAPQCIK
jgi:hypothetical protein